MLFLADRVQAQINNGVFQQQSTPDESRPQITLWATTTLMNIMKRVSGQEWLSYFCSYIF